MQVVFRLKIGWYADCGIDDNTDVVIWSVLETFTAIMCASLMCLRPLLVRCLPALFSASKGGASTITPNPTWASKLASKLRSGNHGVELKSQYDEIGGQEEVIRVQKTWLTETSIDIELQNQGPKGSARLGK